MWIIWIVLIIGNLALFSGSFEDLPLLSILAIVGDLYFIYAFIKGIADSPSKNTRSQVSNSQPTSQQVGMKSTPPSTQRTPPVVNEDNNFKLNQLKFQYRVPNVPSVSTAIDPLQKEMESYQCIEVLQNVNKVISRRRNYAKKMKSIKEEIDGILACPGCSTDRERLKYIKNNEDTLQQKKNEYVVISTEMKSVKVVLLSKEKTAFNRLSTALAEITSSEKSTSGSGVTLSSFVKLKSNIPGTFLLLSRLP